MDSCVFSRRVRSWTVRLLARVLLVVAFVFGLGSASDGWAAGNVGAGSSVGVGYSYCVSGSTTACGSGPDAAAALAIADINAGWCAGGCSYEFERSDGGVYYYYVVLSNGGHNGDFAIFYQGGACASGYTKQTDGTCKSNQPSCPAVGQSSPGGNVASGTSPTQTVLNPLVCISSCAYSYDTYWTGATPGQTGGYAVQWQGLHSTGGACTGSEANASSGSVNQNSNVNCPDRTYQGTVNGQNVCVPYPTQTTGGSSSTTTTDAPASSPAATSTTGTTTTTTCDGTTCTTTTTTTTTGGSSGGSGASGVAGSTCAGGSGASAVAGTCTTTSTQPQTQYCQDNPTAAQCSGSASGGTDCSAAPTCSGDAVSCAILAQQWLARCDLQKSNDPSITLGQQIQAGNDPMSSQLPTPGNATQVDMSQKLSGVDDMGIAAQCMPDINAVVPLPGGSWVMHMDMTPLCSLGQLLGALNMLSTLMLCAYMLKGSF